MKAVLVVAHGSKKTQQNDVLYEIINMVRQNLNSEEYFVEGTFISFKEMNIEFKLKEVIEKGATEIIIVPYLLFAGNYVKNIIPTKIDRFMESYPNIKILYKESLGVDKRLAEIIVDRIIN